MSIELTTGYIVFDSGISETGRHSLLLETGQPIIPLSDPNELFIAGGGVCNGKLAPDMFLVLGGGVVASTCFSNLSQLDMSGGCVGAGIFLGMTLVAVCGSVGGGHQLCTSIVTDAGTIIPVLLIRVSHTITLERNI
jgi:hypothetical protein